MANVLVWADIPVVDLARASRFYEALTGEALTGEAVTQFPGESQVAVIGGPGGDPGTVSADLYVGGTPSHDGPTIYFGSGGDIDGMVERAVSAGGRVLQEKQFMGDMVGWIAFVEDTEGNRIGIQQPGM